MDLEALVIAAVILAAGASLIIATWRLRLRWGVPCLEDYALYVLFFYLMTFANQVLPTAAWGTRWYEHGVLDQTFWILQSLLGLPLALTSVFFLARFVRKLSGRASSKRFVIVYGAAGSLFTAVMAVYAIGFFRPRMIRQTVLVFDAIRLLVTLSLLAIPAAAALHARLIPEPERAKTVRGFALVQAVTLIVFEAVIIIHPPELIHDILRSLFNIPPLLYLALRISTLVPQPLAEANLDRDAATLMAGRGISRREEEIIRLVCRGMTNKEIQEALFISLDTVKRHMTHIFRKLGVRNRAELVALSLKGKPSSDSLDRGPARQDELG